MSGLIVFLVNAAVHNPYPFVLDAGISTLGFLRSSLTGYAFPSTGLFTIACLCAGIFLNNMFWRVKAACAAFFIVAAFSYLYLGLCTPWSLALSVGIAIAAAIGAKIVVNEFNFDITHYRFLITITAVPLFIFVCVILSLYFNDLITLASLSSYLGFIGIYIGIVVSFFIEAGFIKMNFHCDHSYQQVVKCAIGAGATLTVYVGLKLLASLIPGFIFTDMIINLIISLGAFAFYPVIIQKYFSANYN